MLNDSNGILICDRYSAYKSLAIDNQDLFLAFFWVHVRRGFINAQRGGEKLATWSATWVKRIGKLYHLNNERLECLSDPVLLQAKDKKLKEYLQHIAGWRDEELSGPKLEEKPKKVLTSLKKVLAGILPIC